MEILQVETTSPIHMGNCNIVFTFNFFSLTIRNPLVGRKAPRSMENCTRTAHTTTTSLWGGLVWGHPTGGWSKVIQPACMAEHLGLPDSSMIFYWQCVYWCDLNFYLVMEPTYHPLWLGKYRSSSLSCTTSAGFFPNHLHHAYWLGWESITSVFCNLLFMPIT